MLGERVGELSEGIEALMMDQADPGEKVSGRPGRSNSAGTSHEEFRITVHPLPELAMAAVAETSLRGLPGVKKMLSVERTDDRASFLLEVSPEADLISEMRAAMPVDFKVVESEPNEVSLELKWLWGANSI